MTCPALEQAHRAMSVPCPGCGAPLPALSFAFRDLEKSIPALEAFLDAVSPDSVLILRTCGACGGTLSLSLHAWFHLQNQVNEALSAGEDPTVRAIAIPTSKGPPS